jgi:hypothetical protein
MAILLDPQGLLWGKRVRKLSLKTRLYYPLVLGITNFYARIEVDGDFILSKLSSFKDPDLTPESIKGWFTEYEAAKLALLYPADTSVAEPALWAQFDTPVSLRRQQPTNEDNASPVPPEQVYFAWLKGIHGNKWNEYNLSQYQQTLSEKRAEAGRAGGKASGVTRKQSEANGSKTNGASANEAVDVVVDVDVDVVKDVDVDVVEDVVEGESLIYNGSEAISSSMLYPLSISSNETTTKATTTATATAKTKAVLTPPNTPSPPLDIANVFAGIWMKLMAVNPVWDKSKTPKTNWENLLIADFTKLLTQVKPRELLEMLAYSQSLGQQQYNRTTANLVNNTAMILVKTTAAKKVKGWQDIWNSFLTITGITPEDEPEVIDDPVEFLDKAKVTTFNIEIDDELTTE